MEDVIAGLSDANRELIRGLEKRDLWQLHFGLGLYIRNQYGLLQGNEELLLAAGESSFGDPDDASAHIIEAVWTTLRNGE